MKISYNWLKNYIELDETKHSPEALAEVLPFLGFEIEEQIQLGPPQLDKVVVGEVLEFDPHPDADRLRCCKVRVSASEEAPLEIVCGAKKLCCRRPCCGGFARSSLAGKLQDQEVQAARPAVRGNDVFSEGIGGRGGSRWNSYSR